MFDTELEVALRAADAADEVTLPLFRSDILGVAMKADSTPVTQADTGAERAIREVITASLPDDAITGEEYGTSSGEGRRWIIDPIDATVNYVRGVPVWGTLIALEDGDEIAVGVVSAPAIGHRWWASRGAGAYRNGAAITVSEVDSIDGAHLSYNSLVTLEQFGLGSQALHLSRMCERTRGFGDFLSFMFLAEGAIDIVVEPVAKVWDLAPLDVIVSEAGGRFTDLTGTRTVRGGNAVATNGLLHSQVLDVLSR